VCQEIRNTCRPAGIQSSDDPNNQAFGCPNAWTLFRMPFAVFGGFGVLRFRTLGCLESKA
jgi:hypothetical protein